MQAAPGPAPAVDDDSSEEEDSDEEEDEPAPAKKAAAPAKKAAAAPAKAAPKKAAAPAVVEEDDDDEEDDSSEEESEEEVGLLAALCLGIESAALCTVACVHVAVLWHARTRHTTVNSMAVLNDTWCLPSRRPSLRPPLPRARLPQ